VVWDSGGLDLAWESPRIQLLAAAEQGEPQTFDSIVGQRRTAGEAMGDSQQPLGWVFTTQGE
jgi:hypothetical protein